MPLFSLQNSAVPPAVSDAPTNRFRHLAATDALFSPFVELLAVIPGRKSELFAEGIGKIKGAFIAAEIGDHLDGKC